MEHSSQYHNPQKYKDKRVVIVGGSFTGVELAADIAPYAKSVVHVYTHPFWYIKKINKNKYMYLLSLNRVIPRFIPTDSTKPGTSFIPLDLGMYTRRKRPSPNEQFSRTPQIHKIVHSYLRGLVGGKQGQYSPPESSDAPSFVTISGTCLLYI